jgi:L-2,4-diaminobutyrate decarboxylase
LRGATASVYADTVREVADDVAARLVGVTQPFSGASRSELRALVDAVDLDGPPSGTKEALREAGDLYATHAIWFHEPTYTAHLNCPVALPAVGAETMLAAINTSVDTYDQSTVATFMERRLVEWTAGRIGFAVGEEGDAAVADGIFTSGGTQSNFQALFLAREKARRAGTRLEAMRILATAVSHFSIAKSALLLGLPDDAVVTVGTDADGRMSPDALAQTLVDIERTGDTVIAVVATAGTTDRGCIDPLGPIADLCDAVGTWLHVDAAYGCGLLVSPRRRHLLDGIERARSVTVDFHKSFFQPVSSSALVVRERARTSRPSPGTPTTSTPRRTRSPTRSTSPCRPPAGSTRSSSGSRCARSARTASARWSTPSATWPPPCTRTSPRTATSGSWGPPSSPPSCSATSPRASTPRAPTPWCRRCGACCSTRAAPWSPRP